MTTIKIMMIGLIILCCTWIISKNINKEILKELEKQKKINSETIKLFNLEQNAMYTWLSMLRKYLSSAKIKGCTKEQYKNIALGGIGWIDNLFNQIKQDEKSE